MTEPDSMSFQNLKWRCIGPYRGGRVVAVTGHPSDLMTFYFGACAGGVWKTTDGGTYWENVSDGFFNTSSVGAITVSQSDPNVVYAGMGESCVRLDVSHGDGVYKSTDAGKTWTNIGLNDTRHIGRIRVHPQNADVIYVAALGHAFGPNKERGIFRSQNGGKTWEQVLFVSDKAGSVDITMDAKNPRVLYASFWQVIRTPWSLSSGGSDSGLYKTTDGGNSWIQISNNPGMPTGIKGRIGVAVSPSKPERIWAIIESERGGLYRSDDGGLTWTCVNDNTDLRHRPWYYSHVFADPRDSETVWVLNLKAWKSTNGGESFTEIGTPHGDNHDLWIDPNNPERMIEGNDGGACVSFNGGGSWSTIQNQPTSQFYRVATDNQFPYRVYATQQDNSAISVPSRSHKGAIPYSDCYGVGFSESGHIAVDPEDSNIVYSGAIGSASGGGGVLLKYDHLTGQERIVTAWPETFRGWGAKDEKYRFQWTFPIVFSPHNNSILYIGGNKIFKSSNGGSSWDIISPDLTRNDVTRLEPSGGPITKDSTDAECYCTIYSFRESALVEGLLWAGTDDGLIHISHDSGDTWKDVTPRELPEWATVSTIEPSVEDPGTAYIAAHIYKLDDYSPYLFKTSNYGKTWKKISNGIPETEFTRVIRQDPSRPEILYAGTELGIYVSLDDGETWKSFRQNLPITPIHDMVVKEDNLVAATHGRSFWILDNLDLLHQMTEEIFNEEVHLFRPKDSYRPEPIRMGRSPAPGRNYIQLGNSSVATFREIKDSEGNSQNIFLDAGQNPVSGIVVNYYLKTKSKTNITLKLMDTKQNVIKMYESNTESEISKLNTNPGMNFVVWNTRYNGAAKVNGDVTTEDKLEGPKAIPGKYYARLDAGDISITQTFSILKDPRVVATQDDLKAQFDLLMDIRDKLSETHLAINRIRSIREQVVGWKERALQEYSSVESLVNLAGKIDLQLTKIERELIQIDAKSPYDTLKMPTRLNEKLAELTSVVSSADAEPTLQSHQVFNSLSKRIDHQIQLLDSLVEGDIPTYIDLLNDLDISPITVR